MSSKKKSSRLRLRSQNGIANINSRNQNSTVISHYFKKPNSESDEVPFTSEISPKDDDKISESSSSSENKDIPKSVKVNSKTKLLKLNLSDDLSDFSTPKKPIKRVIPKIFEPKFKPKPIPKRNKKPINKKITEASRKFLYESKDYNQEHLQLAIALSKSIQEFENPEGESSQSLNCPDKELTPTQENVLKIRKKLTKFQFKNTDTFDIKNEEIPIKVGKSKKTRNHPFMSTLIRRTCEDRKNIIQQKISNILLEKMIIKHDEIQFYNHLKVCDTLEKYLCDKKILFKKAELCENENFYTNQLVTPSTAKCGNLLRDWSKILGRESTPPREIEQPAKQEELEQNINVSEHLETLKNDLEIHDDSKLLRVKDIVVEIPTTENSLSNSENYIEVSISSKKLRISLNQSEIQTTNNSTTAKCENLLRDWSKILGRESTPPREIEQPTKQEELEQNIKVSEKLETDLDDSKLSRVKAIEIPTLNRLSNSDNNIEVSNPSKELRIPSNQSEIQTTNNSNEQNKNITIRCFTPDLFSESEDEIFFENPTIQTLTIPSIEEEILDLTQSSNSETNLTHESFGKLQFNDKSKDNSNNSNDSLFDLPKFDIKSTNKISQEIVKIVDLSQSSNSNDHESQKTETPKKNYPFSPEMEMNDENELLVVDLSQSSNGNYTISQETSTNTSKINLMEKNQESTLKTSPIENLNQTFIMNFENDREMLVDLSQSSNSNDEQISMKPLEISKKTNYFDTISSVRSPMLENFSNMNQSNFNSDIEDDGEMNVNLSHDDNYSMETPQKQENLSFNNKTISENSTPKSRLSKLKRKSKSFIDENQIQSNTTTLRKFNSFKENFDYELKTSAHISLNANKQKISDSEASNLNSQTESDDSLIVINDDELNYSCSTSYLSSKNRRTSSTSSMNESPSKISSELKETDYSPSKARCSLTNESPMKSPKIENSKKIDISLLLGDSFERELRRTTSLWDRVCGKKQIAITQSQTPTQVHEKKTRNLETPTTQMEIKIHDITPMPNYDAMQTPDIRKELEKYGLKSLKRRRAAQILKYIYEQTHPYEDDSNAVETYSDTEDHQQQVKRSKCASTTKMDDFIPVSPTKIEIVGDLLSKNYSESDLIFETRQSSKIASCRLPLHIAWHNYLSENPELRLKILKYFPIQFEDICVHFKKIGFKYHTNDILSFLDKKCITIRTNQNSHRNQAKSTNNKKRY